ncbi:60S ribosomal protein L30 [Iris pallida]|uniref:60S ribosomal protein L30 n=1 Tax=Iris pallida TaxID=29817 RepID=A0AAX6H7J2_IRIPA|nr:60S ribosomal protein L30 [Iris pallida]KAJ6836966.1 60S ribosomal protein L30 [Iris pallida]
MAPTKKTKKTIHSHDVRLCCVLNAEEDDGEHKQQAGARHEEREVHTRLQDGPQIPQELQRSNLYPYFGPSKTLIFLAVLLDFELWFWDWSLALWLMNSAFEMNAAPYIDFALLFHFGFL